MIRLYMKFLYLILFLVVAYSCENKPKSDDLESLQQQYTIGEISNLSKTDNNNWVQEHSIVVNGTLKEVWELYSVSEKMQTHVAPIIEVDFKNGGKWEASYSLNAKIGDSTNFINEIINIVPYRQFTTKGVRAPFSIEAMKSLRSTMTFEDLGNNQVRVNAITTGWSGITDADYRKKVFDMAGQTNPEILKCLNVRLTQGPLNWKEILKKAN